MGAMPSKTATLRLTGKAAVAMVRHPTLRRVTVRAGTPPAKLGWRVGKIVVRRKVVAQIERVEAAGRTAGALVVVYGPMAAEVFGLVEAPKPRRRAPAFAAGVALGAGAGVAYAFYRNGQR
jgi:hypothetical protein